jgi:hypothetical protein
MEPAEYVAMFRRFYGPTMNAFEAAGKNGKDTDLQERLTGLAREHNRAAGGGTEIHATFLRVTVQA